MPAEVVEKMDMNEVLAELSDMGFNDIETNMRLVRYANATGNTKASVSQIRNTLPIENLREVTDSCFVPPPPPQPQKA